MPFSIQTALITGGASGIGREMALRLANRGVQVAILDKNEQALADTAVESPNITPFTCDVTDFAALGAVIKQVETEIGPVDRFMHCAALMPGGRLDGMSPEQINRLMAINYGGTVNATQAMLPYMRQRNQGEFIVLGSIAGVIHASKFGAYGATKAATNFYMTVLMQENEDTNINFQLVCPSAVNTPLMNQIGTGGPQWLQDSLTNGTGMDTPEFINDSIERALKRNKRINYPGIANPGQFAYRLFPRILRFVLKKRA